MKQHGHELPCSLVCANRRRHRQGLKRFFALYRIVFAISCLALISWQLPAANATNIWADAKTWLLPDPPAIPELSATIYSSSASPELVVVPNSPQLLEYTPHGASPSPLAIFPSNFDTNPPTNTINNIATAAFAPNTPIASQTKTASPAASSTSASPTPSSTPTSTDVDIDAAHNTIFNPLATAVFYLTPHSTLTACTYVLLGFIICALGLVGRRILLFLSGFLLIALRIGGFLSPSGVFFVFFVLLFALGGASLFAYQPIIGLIATNIILGISLGFWFVELSEVNSPSNPATLAVLRGVSTSIVGAGFGCFAFFFSRATMALLAATAGAFVTILGIDCMANTGFTNALQLLLEGQPKGFRSVRPAAYGVLAGWLVGIVVGTIFQTQWRIRKKNQPYQFAFRSENRETSSRMCHDADQNIEKGIGNTGADNGPQSPFAPRPAAADWVKNQWRRMTPSQRSWQPHWLISPVQRANTVARATNDSRPTIGSMFSSGFSTANRSAMPISTVRWCREDSIPSFSTRPALDIINSESNSTGEDAQSQTLTLLVDKPDNSETTSTLSTSQSSLFLSESDVVENSYSTDYGATSVIIETSTSYSKSDDF
ncbi:hypothetical protein BDF19DRAFT_420331 [Syncephalis fuscata]|nr:hypothetical protein BDF19DRAFT_420331 [Syncephalis fuscata]